MNIKNNYHFSKLSTNL